MQFTFDGLRPVHGAQELQELLIQQPRAVCPHGVVEVGLVPFQHMAQSELPGAEECSHNGRAGGGTGCLATEMLRLSLTIRATNSQAMPD